MKKISIIIASLVIFSGVSYAGSVLIQQKATTEKKDDKKPAKTDKKEVKKVPARTKQDKKAPASK
jgi:hypothetical protein